MAEFRAIIADKKNGKSYNKVISGNNATRLLGKRITETIDGIFVEMPGYKLEITGGSDKEGFPMRPELPGPRRRPVLVAGGVGFNPKRKGERRKKAFRGSAISQDIVQLNLKIIQYGPRPPEDLLKPKEKEAEAKK